MVSRRRVESFLVERFEGGESMGRRPDDCIVEEPLSIRLDDTLIATTMRTPGHDFELAVGFCLAEGVLAGHPITGVRYCATDSAADSEFNVVTVETGGLAPPPAPRLGPTSSSCGICGTESIDALCEWLTPLDPPTIDTAVLACVPDLVRTGQGLFDRTGGVHAAAAFNLADGQPTVVREDIGRHNAVDKVVGRLELDGGLPATGHGLFISGRASLEMVQKAWVAGFAVVVSVSAPSNLAVLTARRAGIVLAGFVRGDQLNLYTS